MQNDWKFLNLLIGANDACPLCWEYPRPTVEQAADSFEMVFLLMFLLAALPFFFLLTVCYICSTPIVSIKGDPSST